MRNLIMAALFAFIVSACAAPAATSALDSTTIAPTSAPGSITLPSATEQGTAAPTATAVKPQLFDGNHADDEYLISQMNFGIRPAGSKADRATGDYIIQELNKSGWQVVTQEFNYRGIPIRNVIAKYGEDKGPLLLLGAHYDTRPRANMDKQTPGAPVPGANDGASGVAVLLELARTLDKTKLKNEVWLAFFDAEDNGDLSACDLQVAEMQTPSESCDSTPWTWSIGADHVAENLPTKPEAVIVLDMIGDADQNIYYEKNSDPNIQQTLWRIADQLGYDKWFIPEYRWSMTDDHTPFLTRGIRAVDLIDFDYPAWHTTADTADKVSADSLERVGRVMQTWLENQ